MRRLVFLVPLIVFLGLLVPTPASAETYQEALLRYTNYERTKRGIKPLRLSYCMRDRYAQPWSKRLAASRSLSHQSLSPMMTNCKGTGAGENVAVGNVTPQRMVQMWMNSSGHRANILNTRWNFVGMGATRGSDGRVYGVQDFLRQ